ncbi:MAG TPA: hypothetical protein VF458_19300 [Ktedonobacteraceae bacterium]
MAEQIENNFAAGRSYEPLPGGKTRVKTFARGGRLISDEVMPDEEVTKLIQKSLPLQTVNPCLGKEGLINMSKLIIRDLEAFSEHCPAASEVTAVLQTLGFRLSFHMQAVVPPESSAIPALPPQYHYTDQYGTEIIYLAGRDKPEDGERLPVHKSRFWLWPGANEQAHARAAALLAKAFHFQWVGAQSGRYAKQIA